jgi:hypothetical protein
MLGLWTPSLVPLAQERRLRTGKSEVWKTSVVDRALGALPKNLCATIQRAPCRVREMYILRPPLMNLTSGGRKPFHDNLPYFGWMMWPGDEESPSWTASRHHSR